MSLRLLALAGLLGLVFAAAATAEPGKLAVGIASQTDSSAIRTKLERLTAGTVERSLENLDALVIGVPDVAAASARLELVPAVRYAEKLERSRSIAFVPDDPLVDQQWYLASIRTFDSWPEPPAIDPVLVAVVDSGIDGDHVEFADRIEASRSFVGSTARQDVIGHGTIVAGEIAAALGNAEGVAGASVAARLLIAKVVDPDGTIALDAEADAIRWATDQGARVINLSLGGQRDPRNPNRDTFSQLEADAVEYAYSKGAVVVAATGNCDSVCPYRFASYPSALPHVLGVSALDRSLRAPRFSNRDAVFNDLSAPGVGIVSTFPFALSEADCSPAGYSLCAPPEYVGGEGTSFAAPLVSAAAATLIALRPDLDPSQVMAILEQTAADVARPGRDSKTGRGVVDVAAAIAALDAELPPADALETNDGPGSRAARLFFAPGASQRHVVATLDRFNDPSDVYSVLLRRGQRLAVTFRGPAGMAVDLAVWRPGSRRLDEGRPLRARRSLAARGRLVYTAPRRGRYLVQLRAIDGEGGQYQLAVARR
ncbi:MAG: S8 family serine peptidase [Gaiellales bacterium]